MNKYNASHQGNDCYIHEFWYFNRDVNAYIKVTKVSGWSEEGPKAIAFDADTEIDQVPEEVVYHFKKLRG